MQSTLLWFGVGVVLFSGAPSTVAFSQGASEASCQEMVPGHVRAQRQYLQHSHVTLRTSAPSYLPGQLITVTVRSSRDFMGFLLQARSADGAGVKPRPRGVAAGVRTARAGPTLVGGSWVLAAPGTHTLRCLSEADTLTHSDKQLKRNLSFVWRAPDTPMGDIRFYISVVQSYFVYWPGIKSAVVRDGSRSHWQGSNTTEADEGRSDSPQHEDEVTVLPALNVHGPSQNKSAGPAITRTSSATQIYKFVLTPTEVTHPGLDANCSATLAFVGIKNLTNLVIAHQNGHKTLGSRQNAAKGSETDASETSGRLSRVTDEAGMHTGSPVTHTGDLSSHTSPGQPPFTASGTNTPRPLLPNITTQTSSSPHLHSPEPFFPPKHGEGDRADANVNLQDKNLNTKPMSTATPSTTIILFSQKSKLFTHANPSFEPPTHQSFIYSHKATAPTLSLEHLFNKGTPPDHQFVSELPTPQPGSRQVGPQTGPRQTSPPYPQLRTAAPSSSLHRLQPFSTFLKALPLTVSTQTKHQDQSQSEELSSFHTWSRLHPQTKASPAQLTSEWKLQPSVDPGSSSPLLITSTQVDESQEEKVFEYPEKIKPTSPISALTTHFPSFSGTPQHSPLLPSSSTSSFPVSPLSHHSSTKRRTSPAATVIAMRPSVGSTPSFFSSPKHPPKTTPALSALPSPSPIAIPTYFNSAQPSSTSALPSSASAASPSTNASNHPSSTAVFPQVPLSASSSSPFTSSQHTTGSNPPSSSTISPVVSCAPVSSTASPPSASSSTSISNLISSSFSVPFHSTTPHPGPSPAPRRSLHSPLVSSSSPGPLQRLTVGQRLIIHNHIVSSKSETKLNPTTPRTVVHPNPLPHPDPNFKLNLGNDLNQNADIKPKRPSIPSKSPDKEGKYPDIVPRHSTWELGMLLGCSAGLGMVLVVGVRYMYRQACGKQTEMTLSDREREYGRGERGLIHVQEGGDLVRVRRIRENSFVLLAEYDILASPGD